MCGKIAGYKSDLFASLRGKAEKILEIGVGTGPNLKYYADYPGILVFGVDPNRKMQKYAQAAAETTGLPPSNFRFMQAVCPHSICRNCVNIWVLSSSHLSFILSLVPIGYTPQLCTRKWI